MLRRAPRRAGRPIGGAPSSVGRPSTGSTRWPRRSRARARPRPAARQQSRIVVRSLFLVRSALCFGYRARAMDARPRSTTREASNGPDTSRQVKRSRMPLPPSSASLTADGNLKDTPANRALALAIASQSQFVSKAFVATSHFHDAKSVLFCGDVHDRLDHLRAHGVVANCIVTSPPFYGQRDYGIDGQLGLEEHPQQYIDALVRVFEKCRDVLSDTGSLWVNLGDTYWSGKGAHKSPEVKQSARRFGMRPQDRPGDGKWARPKQLLLIPHRFAIAMQDAGWLVRNDNVWVKPNPVPDQVRDRCSMSHEYVFHFTKARWYYFDREEVGRKHGTSVLPPLDTWVVKTSRGASSHRASFSEDLVRLPILATTPRNGIVLDPFNGSGTSMLVARAHGRRSIGIDLSVEYCEVAKQALLKSRSSHGALSVFKEFASLSRSAWRERGQGHLGRLSDLQARSGPSGGGR